MYSTDGASVMHAACGKHKNGTANTGCTRPQWAAGGPCSLASIKTWTVPTTPHDPFTPQRMTVKHDDCRGPETTRNLFSTPKHVRDSRVNHEKENAATRDERNNRQKPSMPWSSARTQKKKTQFLPHSQNKRKANQVNHDENCTSHKKTSPQSSATNVIS